VWGVFGVALSLGINMIIIVTGLITRCQSVSYVDVLSIGDTWGLSSEQHTAAQDGDEKMRDKRVMKRRSRGTEEQRYIIHKPAVDAGRVWHAVGNRHKDRKSFDRDGGASGWKLTPWCLMAECERVQ